MTESMEDMIVRILGRDATREDAARIKEITRNLPSSYVQSPAAMAGVVLMAGFLQQMHEEFTELLHKGSERFSKELPQRVDQAAIGALNMMRDKLPMNAHDTVTRMMKWLAFSTLVVFVIAAIAGWVAHGTITHRDNIQHQAASEQIFTGCMDAAAGGALTRTSTRAAPSIAPEVYQEKARICAAQYADRRASS